MGINFIPSMTFGMICALFFILAFLFSVLRRKALGIDIETYDEKAYNEALRKQKKDVKFRMKKTPPKHLTRNYIHLVK